MFTKETKMKKYIFQCLLLLACHLYMTQAASVGLQYDDGTQNVLNCPNYATKREECDEDAYKWVVFTWAFPSLVVAAIILLFYIFYMIGKYCCNCCGGRRQHPNFCCPNTGLPAVYNRFDLMRPIFFAFICLALCVAGCVWGIVSTVGLYKQLGNLNTNTKDASDDLKTQSYRVNIRIRNISYYSASAGADVKIDLNDAYLSAQESSLSHMDSLREGTILKFKNKIQKYLWTMYVIGPLLAVFSLLAVIMAFCNCRHCGPMTLVFFFCFFGIISWGLQGLFMSDYFVLKQSCHQVEAYTMNNGNIMKALSGCDDDTLKAGSTALTEISTAYAVQECVLLWQACYDSSTDTTTNVGNGRVFNCPAEMGFIASTSAATGCKDVTAEDMIRWLKDSQLAVDASVLSDSNAQAEGYVCLDESGAVAASCTLAACAETCTTASKVLSSVGRTAKELTTSGKALQEFVRSTTGRSLNINSCDAILQTLVPPNYYACVQTRRNALGVRESWGLLALGCIVGIAVNILGAKRFIPMRDVLVPQYEQ
ncbi:hypothetical protein, conserved [Angomonas deanei]|uniref:Uncharacterized protein n=1 Tax=Angomonas deanei TaxID=59799 RepID=A0A7G2C3C3_9TRYP|nr:hypothetical protein, conserved [Angomonas deanei]